jgi:imidazolonepropionase
VGGDASAADLLIYPIGELVTAESMNGPIHGEAMGAVKTVRDAALAVVGNKIAAVGPAQDVLREFSVEKAATTLDATGKLVTAGLVDPHTHLVFAGNRANEFIMRCQGKTYSEIAKAGGGIVASMTATRHATIEELVETGRKRLRRMLDAGTTTCEVKTGYGLDLDSELRMLQAIAHLSKEQPVELVPTFMAAHAFPPGVDRDQYVQDIVGKMIPSAARMVADFPEGTVVYNDVFCDEGYFSLEETRKILEAGLRNGLRPKVHADEFANLGATTLAFEMKAASADHLLSISNYEIELLSGGSTVAVLLPGTSFYLNLREHAPARKMIESGVAVALGSDFNPGSCHIFSLPLIWGLACLHLRMTPQEALTALTVNSAHAIGRGDKIGQLKAGYQADIVVFDVATLPEIPYNLGWNPVLTVVKNGRIVSDKREH